MHDYLWFLIFIAFMAFLVLADSYRRRKYAKVQIVRIGIEYPNNFHVLGVGYFHAADRRWHRLPWNEFREDRGYFWAGEWRPEPDRRLVLSAAPDVGEIDRVNQAWREADPDAMAIFWARVETEGFGSATRRSGG